jgi:hypothetical protein
MSDVDVENSPVKMGFSGPDSRRLLRNRSVCCSAIVGAIIDYRNSMGC